MQPARVRLAPAAGRIGLLGGSFNPAHAGHRHISLEALKRLRLDRVWWLVSPQNPLKEKDGMAPLAEREAVAAAVADHPRIAVSSLETGLGTRYTIDTVQALKQRFPAADFVWLMGADNLRQLPAAGGAGSSCSARSRLPFSRARPIMRTRLPAKRRCGSQGRGCARNGPRFWPAASPLCGATCRSAATRLPQRR